MSPATLKTSTMFFYSSGSNSTKHQVSRNKVAFADCKFEDCDFSWEKQQYLMFWYVCESMYVYATDLYSRDKPVGMFSKVFQAEKWAISTEKANILYLPQNIKTQMYI